MSRARTAAARRGRAGAVSRHPRRVSGPVRPRAVPGRPRPATPIAAPPFTLGARVRALPDHRLLDRLLRSRAWIWLLGIALGGIVAMQVSLLGMNAGISKSVQTSTDLEHANALLQLEIAELSSGERVNRAAVELGLATPDAGTVEHLRPRKRVDPRRAADSITPPSEAARTNLANGGVVATVAPPVVPPVADTTVPPAPVAAPTTTVTP